MQFKIFQRSDTMLPESKLTYQPKDIYYYQVNLKTSLGVLKVCVTEPLASMAKVEARVLISIINVVDSFNFIFAISNFLGFQYFSIFMR